MGLRLLGCDAPAGVVSDRWVGLRLPDCDALSGVEACRLVGLRLLDCCDALAAAISERAGSERAVGLRTLAGAVLPPAVIDVRRSGDR